jgi:hypothetical protein
MVMNIRSGS